MPAMQMLLHRHRFGSVMRLAGDEALLTRGHGDGADEADHGAEFRAAGEEKPARQGADDPADEPEFEDLEDEVFHAALPLSDLI